MLPNQLGRVRYAMRFLDLGGIVGAATLVWTGLRSVQRLRASRRLSPEMILLASTGAGLLALHLAYVQLNDTYIAAFIPFALLLTAERLRDSETPKSLLAFSAALSMTLILLVAFWMRVEYAGQQAAWKSADALADAGVQPGDIQAPPALGRIPWCIRRLGRSRSSGPLHHAEGQAPWRRRVARSLLCMATQTRRGGRVPRYRVASRRASSRMASRRLTQLS
jgi:hypothetical protein